VHKNHNDVASFKKREQNKDDFYGGPPIRRLFDTCTDKNFNDGYQSQKNSDFVDFAADFFSFSFVVVSVKGIFYEVVSFHDICSLRELQ
jgi:hypothetical protein